MVKARRHDVLALALILLAFSVWSLYNALVNIPFPKPHAQYLSSTEHFMLPPSPPWGPFKPVEVLYNMVGSDIADNTPVNITAWVTISALAKGDWLVSNVDVEPDNAFVLVTTAKGLMAIFPAQFTLNVQTLLSGDELWSGNATIQPTTFGPFVCNVLVRIIPSNGMSAYAAQSRNIQPLLAAGWFDAPNVTSIPIESSRTIAAESNALQASQEEVSLEWLIVFLASLDVTFRIFDYSLYEKEEPRADPADTEP